MQTATTSLAVICLTSVLGTVLAVQWADNAEQVVKFSIVEHQNKLMEVLKASKLFPDIREAKRVGKYSFKNCADPKVTVLNITQLEFSPDPLSFPGTFYVSLQAGIKTTMDSPLKAVVLLERQVGSTWIKIPCLGEIGSCTYDDLCQLLSGAVCPPPFVTSHVPCKCPFPQGSNYTLSHAGFEVDANVFPSGNYHARGSVTHGTTLVGCVDIYASFA